jgi:hypothetical protein
MTTFKTNTGREIRVAANYSARTFTIKTDVATYRTIRLSREEFESCENNTGQDWMRFLNSSDYYKVR